MLKYYQNYANQPDLTDELSIELESILAKKERQLEKVRIEHEDQIVAIKEQKAEKLGQIEAEESAQLENLRQGRGNCTYEGDGRQETCREEHDRILDKIRTERDSQLEEVRKVTGEAQLQVEAEARVELVTIQAQLQQQLDNIRERYSDEIERIMRKCKEVACEETYTTTIPPVTTTPPVATTPPRATTPPAAATTAAATTPPANNTTPPAATTPPAIVTSTTMITYTTTTNPDECITEYDTAIIGYSNPPDATGSDIEQCRILCATKGTVGFVFGTGCNKSGPGCKRCFCMDHYTTQAENYAVSGTTNCVGMYLMSFNGSINHFMALVKK